MKRASQRCRAAALPLPAGFAIFFCALFFPVAVRAQFAAPDAGTTRSLSGQFVVTGPARYSALSRLPELATNADFVRLEPALLSVTAERVKVALRTRRGAEKSFASCIRRRRSTRMF